mgnify:FL=1|tara:strand:+ start:567 stop:944 length:378 start_codon:yes stop_codon:yes gene_type:complete
MAHYAFLNMQNIVTEVIVGKDETDGPTNWEIHYGNIREQVCKRTSYNTRGGAHINNGTPFRKNYAGVGYTYDYGRDAFIPPKPFDSWTLNSNTCLWESPVAYPEDGQLYTWNEETQQWDLVDGTN